MKLSEMEKLVKETVKILIFILSLSACSPLAKGQKKRSAKSRAVSDCSLEFRNLKVCAQLGGAQEFYPVGQSVSFKLVFWQKDSSSFFGPYVDLGFTPHAWLWMIMPSGNHGSRPITVSKALDAGGGVKDGIYDVTDVFFSMPPQSEGEWWELHIELKNSEGIIVDEAVHLLWDSSGV